MDWFPFLLSAQVATLATGINLIIGIAVGWLLARRSFPARDLLGALVTIPLVLPPTVLGYYLLVALGRTSPIGQALEAVGVPLVFTWRGAVVAAAVSSLPLMVQSCRTAFEGVDPELEQVARTLGRSEWEVFRTITLPLAWRGILAGMILSFARALGDFGATLMVAGNIPGRTQTLAIAVYDAVQANDPTRAGILVAVLSVFGVLTLVAAQQLGRRLAA
ncbi:molybdate ABC transporter permease subunit [Thermoflexus sp.]|uniref:molybdate ABC transporter permease subunit n=1 Tax=Thermoflexus sp. TaxID=1969742 RepID=UPI0025EACF54|nr:molybdate ABC transporter permease subunit [Thermoflexus sp.]MDW8180616.1 molybdate ABC transporter permease subunit [Anaerolineae bacterium]MCS6964087.1 molybdate ABC transporter permease subunit [Thermoflexus sp.]MCS7351162.1 molybdate ABC transporter permease subunit [Thermoflexus sp.]MCX7690452.1 molybdate ABC transporter permease subunit [Thermoflexus sp.]MDW8184811.1 molybdate ABC transporter permease subunit [Anaerolineae bacterium]